ncbi:MAG: alanine racemase [Chlamydiales bacterium]|nr:alanine racemase [Chlamydiales bacterium]
MPSSKLIVDYDILKSRYDTIRRSGKQIMPMVKGNGYGLGAYVLSQFYHELGAPFVGVSHGEEAVKLREAGYKAPIFVLSCLDAAAVFEYDLTVALNSYAQFLALQEEGKRRKKTIAVHLQIDTGLNRLGFTLPEAAELPSSPWIEIEGIMSHYKRNDKEQGELFEQVFKRVGQLRWIHMESSNSLDTLPFCNLVRVGAALFTSAVTLKSHIIALRNCGANERVGYREGQQLTRPTKLATIPIGYHDGLHLYSSGKGYVKIRGQKAPYVGNIYMDFLVVDVTDIPHILVGDEVEIFGPQISLEEVASWSNTNIRQLLCCIGPRVEREYVRQSVGAQQTHCAL